jgi:hypothetical protein
VLVGPSLETFVSKNIKEGTSFELALPWPEVVLIMIKINQFIIKTIIVISML